MPTVPRHHSCSFSPRRADAQLIRPRRRSFCIEYQNEFTTEGGKLHGAVKPVMTSTGMLDKSVELRAAARAAGVKVFHEGITFADDALDNPN